MKKVAITYDEDYDVTPYAEAVRAAGMDPVLVTPSHPLESLDSVAGLVLSGGADLSSALYGQPPHPSADEPILDRDDLEQRLLREALARDVPVLAICRGMQLLNVSHPGGTLHQDIPGHVVRTLDKSRDAHEITPHVDSRLFGILGPGDHPVNSRHHQAVHRLGRGLFISARAADGIIEGLERPDRRFVVGVQWHPENQIHRHVAQKNLFLALAAAL